MELNKIAAAILLAGLIGMITGKVSTILYYGGDHHPGGEHKVTRGYTIEGADEITEGGAAPAEVEIASIIPLLHSADVAAGEDFFNKRCTTCHVADKGGANKIGPGLWGVVGADKGTHAGFNYSKAMQASEGNWDFESLNHFLLRPNKYIPGTIMAYAGIAKDQDRANVIAFLRSKSDAPLAIPAAPAEAPAAEAPAADAADDAKEEPAVKE